MNVKEIEHVADVLINSLREDPNMPLFIGLLLSEVTVLDIEKPPAIRTVEVSDQTYIRQRINYAITDAGQYLKSLEDIQFDRATQRWLRLTHFGIYDAQNGGNLLLLKPVGSVTNCEVGEAIRILASELRIYLGKHPFLQER